MQEDPVGSQGHQRAGYLPYLPSPLLDHWRAVQADDHADLQDENAECTRTPVEAGSLLRLLTPDRHLQRPEPGQAAPRPLQPHPPELPGAL